VQEYAFEVKLVAMVRVRARDESLARKVLTSALGSSERGRAKAGS
jgi:hypothetical protein